MEPSAAGGIPLADLTGDDDLFEEDLAALDELAALARAEALRRANAQRAAEAAGGDFPWMFVIIPFAIAGGLTLLYGLWRFWHRKMTPAEQAYTKMVRTGTLLGVRRHRWQTPLEYAAAVGDMVPGVAESAMIIAVEFERNRYASPETESISDGMGRHWRRVLRGLLGHRLRFFGGSRSELNERRGTA